MAVGQHLRDKHGHQIVFVKLRGINELDNYTSDKLSKTVSSALLGPQSSSLTAANIKDTLRHNCKNKTLIILDNVEDALIPPIKESFLELIKIMVSVNGIKVLCTSRKKVRCHRNKHIPG